MSRTHTILLLMCALLLCPVLAAGQTPTPTPATASTPTEKKKEPAPEVPTLDAAWKPVLVDHIFGIRGGYGLGSMRREPAVETQPLPYGLLNFGLSYRFDVPEQKYVGCIEIDVQFMEKGYAYALYFESDEVYTRKYQVIELPILWQPYFPLGKGESRIFLNAGPYLSYTLSGTEWVYNKKTDYKTEPQTYVYDPLRDNRIEYGVVAGGGVAVGIGRFAMTLDFRYNIMLSDILKGVNKYEGNPFRSPVDQMSLSFGVQYRFIKGKVKKNE